MPIQGSGVPGLSSSIALNLMEGIANRVLPPGMGYEWTELAYQQKAAGSGATMIFLMAVVFVFLVLLVTDILGFTKVFPFTRSIR